MEDQRTFKEKNLATAQRTMESLQAEKRKRERDLDLLRISEPKLVKELSGLKESIARMVKDMQVGVCVCDVDGVFLLWYFSFFIVTFLFSVTFLKYSHIV
jgi:hypothetical protein